VGRRLLLLVCSAAVGLAWGSPALGSGFTRSDVTVTMDDGTPLASTLYEPAGETPPAAGWPAIVMFHGLGGTRASMNRLAEQSFATEGYAVFTFDARGHGASGGLFSADGPREIADVRALFADLAARPDIDERHIGAWGISLGGGAVWRSLVDGIPFAAAEMVETWTDLYSALVPQDLSKSGAVFAFLNSVPPERTSPDVLAIRQDALQSTNLDALRAFSAQRSSRADLGRITTPVFMLQGRRDFAFGIDQATAGFRGLAGPKRLYVGDFGHSPSTFPGPDIGLVLSEGSDWFARYLKGVPNGIDTRPPVEVAPDPFDQTPAASFAGLPPTRSVTYKLAGRKATIGSAGKVVRGLAPTKTRLETFGAPTATVGVPALRNWTHLVAVLTAVTPAGQTVVVSEGGASTTRHRRGRLTIRMVSDATVIPRGSRLRLTLAGASTAQDPQNLLYLEGVPAGARITIDEGSLTLPVLRRPISP
jgi:predicted acyl esterase